ncbi:MAG: hypothetical protein WC710_13550 [Gallionella sp.]|jgi:hypothetical protein
MNIDNKLMDFIQTYPGSAPELSAGTGYPIKLVRERITELIRQGLVEATMMRQGNRHGIIYQMVRTRARA